MHLLHGLVALLNSRLLLLVQTLMETLAILLHGAKVFLNLLMLTTGLVSVKGLAAGGALHGARLRPGLLHGLVAGAVLVALLGGCLGVQALPLLLTLLTHGALTSALTRTLTGAGCWALAALPLLAAATTTAGTLLRP